MYWWAALGLFNDMTDEIRVQRWSQVGTARLEVGWRLSVSGPILIKVDLVTVAS